MIAGKLIRATMLGGFAVLAIPAAQAQTSLSGGCGTGDATELTVGVLAQVPAGKAQRFAVSLTADEGVLVDLFDLDPRPSRDGDDEHEMSSSGGADPATRALRLCDPAGAQLAPRASDIFAKGGSVTDTGEGEQLRLQVPKAGRYVIAVQSGDAPRELLVRRRAAGAANAPIITMNLGQTQKGIVSSSAPMVYAFSAAAGQWVEITATSEKDTLLRLAAPSRDGSYSQVAENDDADQLNPRLRRRIPITGTYYVQVDSLADDPGDFTLNAKSIPAPPPPPSPVALRVGASVTGKLVDGDDVRVYALPVVAGRSYRLDLTAPYDGVVSIGVVNPLESDDGESGPDAVFSEIKSQDSGTTGTERLSFTARANGQLLVRVKCFGIGESDGSYTLIANDQGM